MCALQLEQHIESFRHILQDSEIRKFRATQKINNESKEISQRTQEVNALSYQLDVAVTRSIQLIDQLVAIYNISKSLCGSLYMLWSVLYRKCKMAQRIEEHREVETFLDGVFAVAPQGLTSIIITVLECYSTSLEYPGYLDENLPPCEAVMSRYHALQNANKYINDKRNGAIYEVAVP